MVQGPARTFEQFLERFPVVELPVSLTDQSISDFERNSDPLSPEMINRFVEPGEEEQGEFIEYVPCMRIPKTHDFHAVVIWRGDLMKYHYILATYDKEGNSLGSATIAGTESDGTSVLRSVATIDEEWIIHIVEGEHNPDDAMYAPLDSRGYRMELLATGEIIFLLDEMTSDTEG